MEPRRGEEDIEFYMRRPAEQCACLFFRNNLGHPRIQEWRDRYAKVMPKHVWVVDHLRSGQLPNEEGRYAFYYDNEIPGRVRNYPLTRKTRTEAVANSGRVYDFCKTYVDLNKRGPTNQEIAAGTDLGIATVANHLKKLKQSGALDTFTTKRVLESNGKVCYVNKRSMVVKTTL